MTGIKLSASSLSNQLSSSVKTSSVHSDHEEDDDKCNQLLFVSCYSDFDRLGMYSTCNHQRHLCLCTYQTQLTFSCFVFLCSIAHGPRGTQAKHPIYVYRLNDSDGSMVLMNVTGDPKDVLNPAFTRFHPR
jgi:hypothetical protein